MQRKWGSKTRDERQAARRQKVLTAAIEVYGSVGYQNATVKAVCTAAGLTERYFYESFVNNEDLLSQCFRAVTSDLLIRMRDAASDEAAGNRDRARAALRVYLSSLKQNPASARIFLLEMASVSPATKALVSESLDEFGALLINVLTADPDLTILSSSLLLRGVVGGGLHILQAWIETNYAENIETVIEMNLRLYNTLVVAGAW